MCIGAVLDLIFAINESFFKIMIKYVEDGNIQNKNIGFFIEFHISLPQLFYCMLFIDIKSQFFLHRNTIEK